MNQEMTKSRERISAENQLQMYVEQYANNQIPGSGIAAAFMLGVFGMFIIALTVFAIRCGMFGAV